MRCVYCFQAFCRFWQSPFLLLIRLIWGYQFLITGMGKLMNLANTSQFFADLGIFMPKSAAFIVGFFELLGGLALIIGLGSRLMCVPLIVIMITAYTIAHSDQLTFFSFITDPVTFALERPFGFLYTVLVVLIFGPGKISLDYLLCRKKSPPN